MRLLVISDSHGEIYKAATAVRNTENVDILLHLGDYFRDAQRLQEMFPGLRVEYIYGNSDFMVGNTKSEKLLVCDGVKIFMTHGHRYSIKWGYDRLYMKADDVHADLMLFGHTHVAEILRHNGRVFLNPGSISESRSVKSESYAVIDIKNGIFDHKLYYM